MACCLYGSPAGMVPGGGFFAGFRQSVSHTTGLRGGVAYFFPSNNKFSPSKAQGMCRAEKEMLPSIAFSYPNTSKGLPPT